MILPSFVGKIGRDRFGQLAEENLEREGVVAHFVEDDAHLTGSVAVFVDHTGERSMVFCDQKYKVRRLAAKLGGEPASVGAITGNHSQAQRERTLGAFRAGRIRSLVATDVAARGLDIPDVAQVIHYELPINPNSYVHRVGRTGRAEKEGSTFLILSQAEEREYLRMVRQLRIETKKTSASDVRNPASRRGDAHG